MQRRINPERQRLLELARGKDCLVVGPLGTYKSYREGALDIWDFRYLSDIAHSLTGIDNCEELVEVARADGWANLILGDAENFDLGRKFDVIFAADLIEHLGRPVDFLICSARHLRPEGVVIVETPNPIAVNVCMRALVSGDVVSYEEHTCWVDRCNAIELGRRAGLKCDVDFYSPINYFSRGAWLRTHIYRAIGRLRPRLNGKAVYTYSAISIPG